MKPLWIFRSSFYENQGFLGSTPISSTSIKLLQKQSGLWILQEDGPAEELRVGHRTVEVRGHTQLSRQHASAPENVEGMKLFTSGFLKDTPHSLP